MSGKKFSCKWCKKDFVSAHNLEKHTKGCKIKKQVEEGESIEERELRESLAKLEYEQQRHLQQEEQKDILQDSTIEELRALLTAERHEKEEFLKLLIREREEKQRIMEILSRLQTLLNEI